MSGTDNVKTAARNGLFAQIKLEKSSSVYGKAVDWFLKKWLEARGRLEMGQEAEEDSPFFVYVLGSNETPSTAAVLKLSERFATAQEAPDEAGSESDSLEFDDEAPAGEPAPAAAPLDPPAAQPESSPPPAAQPESSPPPAPAAQPESESSPPPTAQSGSSPAEAAGQVPVPLPAAKKSFVAPAQKAFVAPPVSASKPPSKGKGKGKTGTVAKDKSGKKEGKKKEGQTKEGKTGKTKKDPNAPKKAPTSYLIYTSKNRAAYLADNPGSSPKEVVSGLGAQWNALSDEDKRPYVTEAAELKRQQDPLIVEYRLANPSSAPSTPRSKKTKASDHEPSSRKKGAKKAKLSLLSGSGEEGEVDDEGEEGEGQTSYVAKTKAHRAAASVKSYDNDEDEDEDEEHEMEVETQPVVAKKKKLARSSTGGSSEKKHVRDSASLGIKQEDLAQDDDLLNTDFLPPYHSAFPPDDAVAKENEVVVILAPYRDFISTQQQFLAQHERDLVQQICVYNAHFVVGTVKTIQKPSTLATPPGDEDSDADCLNLVTISTRQGRVFTILHVDYTSPLLTGDRFVISKTLFDSSMKAPWLEIESPVRRMFALEEDDEQEEGAEPQAEWLEGIVYHSSPDLATNPYNAISVVWTGQERGTKEWIYLYNQSSNECSPWDLEISRFKRHSHQYRPFKLPKSITGVGHLSAQTILDFLTDHDSAHLFLIPMADLSHEWREMFPDKKDSLNLIILQTNFGRGRYNGSVGITTLFRDLELMVANGKRFNACNRDFLTWRQIDMYEKTVNLVKRHVAASHNIASLRESVQEQIKLAKDLDMESREV